MNLRSTLVTIVAALAVVSMPSTAQPAATTAAPQPTPALTGPVPTPASTQTGPAPTPASTQTGPAPTPASTQTGPAPTPASTKQAECTDVSVEGDATYCITGPICSGGGDSPAGSNCPKVGDIAVVDCLKTLKSYTEAGKCVAPVDAVCKKIKTGAWGCVWNTDSQPTPAPSNNGDKPTPAPSNNSDKPTPAPTTPIPPTSSTPTPGSTDNDFITFAPSTPPPTSPIPTPGNTNDDFITLPPTTPPPTTEAPAVNAVQFSAGAVTGGSQAAAGVVASVAVVGAVAAIAAVVIYKRKTQRTADDLDSVHVDVITP